MSRTSDSITVTVEGFGPTHAIQEEPNGWPVLISAPAARALCRQVEALMNAHRDQRGPRLFLFANVAMEQVSYAQVEAELLERQGRWARQQHTPIAPAPLAVVEPSARALHIVRPVID